MRKHCASTISLFPAMDLGEVQRGDIFELGRHRLACIDATSKADVARLFDGRKPTLVVTSPPYADARAYNDPIPCWDSMMLGALDGHEFADDVQLLVNLGVVHRKGEWVPYWCEWVHTMRHREWRHVGQYVWDKTYGMPGYFGSRPNPAHELIFHLNKKSSDINKMTSCYSGRTSASRAGNRKKDGTVPKQKKSILQKLKTPDSVFRVGPARFGEACGHPAQMPVALASRLTKAWKKEVCVTYDPFGGSGTTLLACEQEDVEGLAAEISPQYCEIAIRRWRKIHPDKPVSRIIG